MAREKSGCFTWCVRLREACNEMWARFRNRLRRRFYARRGQTVDPDSILNETGTKDMVLSKTPRKSHIVIPDIFAGSGATEDPLNAECVTNKDFDRQVGEYVAKIIQTAADLLLSHNQIITMDADDNVCLTPSVISQIADRTVTDSLTHIVIGNDSNQSANRGNKSKIIVELIERHGIIADDKVGAAGVPSGKA